jgi:Bacterial Ig-like domain (group 2)
MRLTSRLSPSWLLLLAGCGDDNGPAASGTPPVVLGSSQVASVVITPQNVLVAIGDSVRLVAATRDISGAPLVGRRVVWTSQTPATATVSTEGVVRALALGAAVVITANSEGAIGTALVTTTR